MVDTSSKVQWKPGCYRAFLKASIYALENSEVKTDNVVGCRSVVVEVKASEIIWGSKS